MTDRDDRPPLVDRPDRRRLRRFVQTCLRILAAAGLLGGALAASGLDLPTVPGTLTDAQQRDVLAGIDVVGRRGFLYEVSRPATDDGREGRKLFLYGTIHLGRVGSEPFNGPLMRALEQSRRLALEADPTDTAETQVLAAQLGQYGAGDGLHRHVPARLMARVRAYGEKKGLPSDRVDRFKPWLLANMIALSGVGDAGLDTALGSELYLSGFARGRGLPIVEVEGLEAQLRMLAALPDALQTAQLDEALDDVDSAEATGETRALFDLWLRGDAPAGDALVADMHREANDKAFERYFVEQLIDRRNRTMADKAESYLERPGNTLFAVGALHLFGAAGLIREFERRGYRVVDLQPPIASAR